MRSRKRVRLVLDNYWQMPACGVTEPAGYEPLDYEYVNRIREKLNLGPLAYGEVTRRSNGLRRLWARLLRNAR